MQMMPPLHGGSLENVRKWREELNHHDPGVGYFSNPVKTVLLTKQEFLPRAKEIFSGTGMSITTEGKVTLGCPIGTNSFMTSVVSAKISEWTDQISKLAEVAVTEPHAAYCAFGHGVFGNWTYLCRVFPFRDGVLQAIENVIHHRLIPSTIGFDSPSPPERAWMVLPI